MKKETAHELRGSDDFAREQKVLQILPDLGLEVDISRLIERRLANRAELRFRLLTNFVRQLDEDSTKVPGYIFRRNRLLHR